MRKKVVLSIVVISLALATWSAYDLVQEKQRRLQYQIKQMNVMLARIDPAKRKPYSLDWDSLWSAVETARQVLPDYGSDWYWICAEGGNDREQPDRRGKLLIDERNGKKTEYRRKVQPGDWKDLSLLSQIVESLEGNIVVHEQRSKLQVFHFSTTVKATVTLPAKALAEFVDRCGKMEALIRWQPPTRLEQPAKQLVSFDLQFTLFRYVGGSSRLDDPYRFAQRYGCDGLHSDRVVQYIPRLNGLQEIQAQLCKKLEEQYHQAVSILLFDILKDDVGRRNQIIQQLEEDIGNNKPLQLLLEDHLAKE